MNDIKSLFKAAAGQKIEVTGTVARIVSQLSAQMDRSEGVLKHSVGITTGLESFGEDSPHQTQQTFGDLYSSIGQLVAGIESFGMGDDATPVSERIQSNQQVAAAIAAAEYGNEMSYRKRLVSMSSVTPTNDKNIRNVVQHLSGPFGTVPTLSAGLENYDEKPTRDFRVISIAYNLTAARQDAFSERLFPTSVAQATEGGIVQNLTYAAVLEDVYHQVSGQKYDTREINLVEAFRDPKVLEDSSTLIIPIITAGAQSSEAHFVAPADFTPADAVSENGAAYKTAPLKIGASFDLMGISNQQALISAGLLDVSDNIDPALRLKNVYLKMGGKTFKFKVDRLPSAVLQPSQVGDTRKGILDFDSNVIKLDGTTRAVDGSTNAAITELATQKIVVRLGVRLNGSIELQFGNTFINAPAVRVHALIDQNGEPVSPTGGVGAGVITALGAITVLGYDLDARFTNTNRRQRGQLIQTRTVQFRHPIPLGSPITVPSSTMEQNGPAGVVQTLLVATNVRNSNNAVIRTLNYLSQLRELGNHPGEKPKFGDVEGAVGMLMHPTYKYHALDLRKSIDTLTSKDRWEDVCSTILNTIKGMLFPAYRDSNIEPAFQTITGNADERPMFIIATDKEIANYLMTKGDIRTLGPQFKFDIVATPNKLFDGKIIVVPTREKPEENDILNWGQFYYVPTIVADLPIPRNGGVSREIAAIPYNLHVNNIPFAIEIDVVGLREVMSESQFNATLADGFDGLAAAFAEGPTTP